MSAAAVTAAASSPSPAASPSSSSPAIHNFSFEFMESLIHVQVWFLNASLFVWIGDSSATMHSLTLAIRTAMDSTPSSSILLGHGHALGSGSTPSAFQSNDAGGSGMSIEEDQVGVGMAQRLSVIFDLPVFVSLNLAPTPNSFTPNGSVGDEVTTFVERSVIKELKVCQKLGMIRKE